MQGFIQKTPKMLRLLHLGRECIFLEKHDLAGVKIYGNCKKKGKFTG